MDPKDSQQASALFRRFRERGDPAALTGVFDLVASELFALAQHLARDGAEAEDLVQDTFLLAIQKVRRFDPGRPVVPWLVGILAREAAKQQRRRRRRPDLDRMSTPSTPEGARTALDAELRAALESALAELPATQREVLRAHLDGGEAPREIAARLGRAPGTVRVQLHRGLAALRRALPGGLALGALGWSATRGSAAVRAAVEREAALRGPALALSSAGALSLPALPCIGALVVSTKTVALAGLAGLALAGALLWRADPVQQPGVSPPARVAPLAPPRGELDAVAGELVDPVERAARDPELAGELPPTRPPLASASTGAVRVRGTITGTTVVPEGGFELTVRVGKERPRAETVPVAGEGPYAVALDALVGDDDPRALDVLVVLEAEGYVPSSAWARPTDGEGGTTYQADLEAHPILRVLRGRVRAAGAVPSGSPWVAFLPDGLSPPLDWQPLDETRLDADGAFELALYDGRGGALLAVVDGFLVAHVPVAAADRGTIDLGTIELERGAAIEGSALCEGAPMPEGSLVRATLEYRSSPWTLATRQAVLVGPGRAAHRQVVAPVDADGRFELLGLVAGLEYGLVAEPARGSELDAGELLTLGSPGARVRAPARGVELDWGLAAVRLFVRCEGEPVGGAHVTPRLEPTDPRAQLPPVIRGDWDQKAYGGSEGALDLLLARDAATLLEVAAPGCEARRVRVDPRDLEPPRELEVELARGAAAPSLLVRFEYDGPGTLDGAYAFLMLYGSAGLERAGPVVVQGGAARFVELPSGSTTGHLSLHFPQSVAFADLPIDCLPAQGLDLSGLTPGKELERVVDARGGGRVELRLVGRDPLLDPPEFELIEAAGNVARPFLLREDPRGHDTTRAIDSDGPFYLGRALFAGRYTLRQVGPAYDETEMEVEVAAGQSQVVTFQLTPR